MAAKKMPWALPVTAANMANPMPSAIAFKLRWMALPHGVAIGQSHRDFRDRRENMRPESHPPHRLLNPHEAYLLKLKDLVGPEGLRKHIKNKWLPIQLATNVSTLFLLGG